MGKEVLDLLHHDFGQVAMPLDVAVIGKQAVHGHTKQLLVAALLVFHLQHAHRPRLDDRSGDEGRPGDHQRVERIAVRSEEHTSELQSLMRISYAVFCLKTKNKPQHTIASTNPNSAYN